ncbi:MAG: DUF1178 family protein [Burkholderiales bacterium]
MVIYQLICARRHEFEGWFGSGDEYDRQLGRRQISCPICQNAEIARLPSAPHVRNAKDKAQPMSDPRSPQQRAGQQLLNALYRASEDVGNTFPEEARKIHYKETEARNIRGTATQGELRELKEEGIEVLSLPQHPAPGKLH